MFNYIDMVNNISLKIKHECMPRVDVEERRWGVGAPWKDPFFFNLLSKITE